MKYVNKRDTIKETIFSQCFKEIKTLTLYFQNGLFGVHVFKNIWVQKKLIQIID